MRVLVKEYRLRRNMSQLQLAERSGIKQAIISMVETGEVKYPRIDTMAKLAKGLRCTVDDLIDENDERTGA